MWFGNEQNPKGPSWHKARPVIKELSDTRVALQAPPLQPNVYMPFAFDDEPDCFDLDSPDTLETIDYRSPKPSGSERSDRRITIWSSGWNFTGRPLLDGHSIGDLQVELVLEEIDELPINCSLFRREDLTRYAKGYFSEGWLGSFHHGFGEPDERNIYDLSPPRWPNYLAPLNNQWLGLNGQNWLYFEAQPLREGSDDFYWLCPIGHRRCLRATFSVARHLSNAGNSYRIQRSPIDNYRDLMEKIMSTITVELSEQSRQEQLSIENPENHYPLFHCTAAQVEQAKHILYMRSDICYRDKSKPQDADHRAPKEDVAAFIEQRIQPRPLPGCLAIGPAFSKTDTVAPKTSPPAEIKLQTENK
ncbi:hypothetical protein [Microbulbifer sp. Q7]|uniref:hypothetical protein n=1 Tax=Microbulbifer sp. Q7 TaxID=1785091 RepID=UPI0008297C52|nr:hypothetical protein [Microbulbifer sp. Q7]